jgi:Transglutaminase-like superfamily
MSCRLGVVVLIHAALAIAPIAADDAKDNVILETWDAAYCEGARAGFIHTTGVEMSRGGQKMVRTIADMQLLVKRGKQLLQVRAETGDDELPDGAVIATFMKQTVGRSKPTLIIGQVKGNQLEFMLDGKAGAMKPAPWDSKALGVYRQQTLWSDKKVLPATAFSYYAFEPTVNLVVRMDVAVKDWQEVQLPGAASTRKLLQVSTIPEKLEGLQLPEVVTWLDEDLRQVRQDTEIPGLGRFTFVRTTKDFALAPTSGAAAVDVGFGQVIRLNKKIPRPHDTLAVVIRVTVQGDNDAAAAFAQDGRQKVRSAKASVCELEVEASHGPKNGSQQREVPSEFTQSSHFITAADSKVQELARKAVGKEADPWKKALAIEKWLHRNMRATAADALNPADQVARSLEGDCTEYAMLMTAMCRAQGVPAKTAIGLLYQDSKAGPAMVFHMWTEVSVQGQWVPLDATLGRGGVGATHLKITDHSWHETRTLTPLMPLLRILGKTQIEIVSVR